MCRGKEVLSIPGRERRVKVGGANTSDSEVAGGVWEGTGSHEPSTPVTERRQVSYSKVSRSKAREAQQV